MGRVIRIISAIGGVVFIVLGFFFYFNNSPQANAYIPYICFGAGTVLLIVAIINMLLAEETTTLTIKIWLSSGLICALAIAGYVVLKIFGAIDVIIYGGAGFLLTAIAFVLVYCETKCPYCGKSWAFEHKSSKREKKWLGAGVWVEHSCKNCGYERRKRIPWYRQ